MLLTREEMNVDHTAADQQMFEQFNTAGTGQMTLEEYLAFASAKGGGEADVD